MLLLPSRVASCIVDSFALMVFSCRYCTRCHSSSLLLPLSLSLPDSASRVRDSRGTHAHTDKRSRKADPLVHAFDFIFVHSLLASRTRVATDAREHRRRHRHSCSLALEGERQRGCASRVRVFCRKRLHPLSAGCPSLMLRLALISSDQCADRSLRSGEEKREDGRRRRDERQERLAS